MLNKNQYLERIKIEDMPNDDMRLIAENCGLDVAMNLMRGMGGTSIYVPKQPYYKLIDRIIQEQKNINPKEIATALGVTERYVRNLWKQTKVERNQIGMDFADEN